MSNINQLLAKALSTTSEDEAMACLRMARKKGGRLEDSSSSSEYNGHSAKYWYEKAAMYYAKAKEKSDGLTHDQQNTSSGCTRTNAKMLYGFFARNLISKPKFVA